MIVNKGYKVEIRPNNRQRTLLEQAAGCARFAYNWGLNQRIELYMNENKSTNAIEQHRELCKLKKENFPWMYNVTKCAPQEALRNLDNAFKRFFRNVKKGEKPGFPKFKKKHASEQSFKVTTGKFYVTKTSVKIPKISGAIRIKDRQTGKNRPESYIPVKGVKYLAFTLSKEAGRWFCAVNCEVEIKDPPDVDINSPVTGIDVGIKELATVSDGTVYHNPKSYRKLERRLNRKQRERCRRKKGSSNRRKSIQALQKLHYRIRKCREDYIHKMTTDLVKTKPGLLVIEDFGVNGMLKNRKLSKSLSDAGFGKIRRQLEYKAGWYGSEVLVADRFFPSSKTCSGCGKVKEKLNLSDRVYRCVCAV